MLANAGAGFGRAGAESQDGGSSGEPDLLDIAGIGFGPEKDKPDLLETAGIGSRIYEGKNTLLGSGAVAGTEAGNGIVAG